MQFFHCTRHSQSVGELLPPSSCQLGLAREAAAEVEPVRLARARHGPGLVSSAHSLRHARCAQPSINHAPSPTRRLQLQFCRPISPEPRRVLHPRRRRHSSSAPDGFPRRTRPLLREARQGMAPDRLSRCLICEIYNPGVRVGV
jgi:hypothetical protein